MAEAAKPLTAKAKLALSRGQLLAAMGYEEIKGETASVQLTEIPKPEASAAGMGAKVRRSIVGRWWRRHPLHGAVQLAEPFLQDYAHRHPARLMAYGAATGALLWLLKPWKLLSAATMTTLLLKSSNLPGVVSAWVSSHDMEDEAFPPPV